MHFNYHQLGVSLLVVAVCGENYLPILYWHSAGSTCCGEEFNKYSELIKTHLNNDVYIKAVQIGSTERSDRVRSMLMHPFDQIKLVCDMIKSDEKLHGGYNAVGMSQGALFLRGLAQTCPWPPMRNLISLGGPQQGVHLYPRCGEYYYDYRCVAIQNRIDRLAYTSLAQRFFTPATYWHDLNDERYRTENTFLAIINNEKAINSEYAENLKALHKLILVKYEDDIGVVPNESTWFGYYDADGNTIPLEDLPLYKEDKLGLKSMKESGKLIFLTSPLGHLKLDETWFISTIIPYLKEK